MLRGHVVSPDTLIEWKIQTKVIQSSHSRESFEFSRMLFEEAFCVFYLSIQIIPRLFADLGFESRQFLYTKNALLSPMADRDDWHRALRDKCVHVKVFSVSSQNAHDLVFSQPYITRMD